jgi:hypothetical protein
LIDINTRDLPSSRYPPTLEIYLEPGSQAEMTTLFYFPVYYCTIQYMAKAVSANELAEEVQANPAAFRYYLRNNWEGRLKYQRWLFTRAQANKIKAAYLTSAKYGVKKMVRPRPAVPDNRQLKLKLPIKNSPDSRKPHTKSSGQAKS